MRQLVWPWVRQVIRRLIQRGSRFLHCPVGLLPRDRLPRARGRLLQSSIWLRAGGRIRPRGGQGFRLGP